MFLLKSQLENWTPIVLNGSDTQPHSDPFLNIPDHLKSTITRAESEQSVEVSKYFKLKTDRPIDPISFRNTSG